MKIGIKFCGGCNPRYERGEFVKGIKEEFDEGYDFELAEEHKHYDFLLVVGGCTNCCANYENINASEIFKVKRVNDYEKVINQIKMIK